MITNESFANFLVSLLIFTWIIVYFRIMEAVARRCSVKKVFLEFSQHSQENTYARACFCKISKNTFSYRTPPVAPVKFSKNICPFFLTLSMKRLTCRTFRKLSKENYKISILVKIPQLNPGRTKLQLIFPKSDPQPELETLHKKWRNPSWKTLFFVQWKYLGN